MSKDIESIPAIKTVAECNAAHQRFISGCQDAIAIGHFLKQQKDKLEHGQWVPWVKDNLAFDVRTAQRYMKLYDNRQFIGEKNDTLSFLSLTEAHRKVAKSRKAAKPAQKQVYIM